MSNRAEAQPRREEEIAFLSMEQVLGIRIRLADAGAGESQPDGEWLTPEGRRGIVEVTGPDESELLAEWARAKREGRLQSENGAQSPRVGQLSDVCQELLAQPWAQSNIAKLLLKRADERHLFLHVRGEQLGFHFYRLSDEYKHSRYEQVGDLPLPEGLSDVWFRGRAKLAEDPALTELRLARFQTGTGWHRYVVRIPELSLPSPARGLRDDPILADLRHPRDRSRLN